MNTPYTHYNTQHTQNNTEDLYARQYAGSLPLEVLSIPT